MKKQLLVLVTTLSIACIVKAQNFSGHYTLQSKEMIDGKEYLNAIAHELNITQTKDSIKIVRLMPAANDQTTTSVETLPLNGKQIVTTTASKRQKISSISIGKEKSTATISATLSYPDKPGEIEVKNTEVWVIEADGTLTITKTSDATVTDDWTIKAVFKKQ